MKTLMTLALLTFTPFAMAQGTWKISCMSDEGISFYSDNGFAEINFVDTDNDGTKVHLSEEVEIENYNLGSNTASVAITWVGEQKILNEHYENSCNSDQNSTDFKQTVQIVKDRDVRAVDVICHEEILTSASATEDSCEK